jgi:sodium transport system permease protein
VAGVSFFFRDLMTGEATLPLGMLVLASTTGYAALALVFASRAFGSERVLFGDEAEAAEVRDEGLVERWQRRVASAGVPTRAEAVLLVAFVAVLFFWGGIQLQIRLGESGLLAAEWLLLFLPAIGFIALGGYDPVRSMSLRRPDGVTLLGALILISGAMPLVWVLGWLQTFVLPVPWEILEGLEELVTADSPGRLAWLILLLAFTPAICEEALFRGVLLGGTRELEPWRMIVLNGVVFGAFHLSFETVIRFLPTATLGMVMAWAVWRTGSIFVGVLMHFVNNGMIVVLASTPGLQELFADPEAPPPLWLVPVGLVLLASGFHILLRRPAPEGATPLLPDDDT